jgi:uncharacterized membrane protein
MKESKLARLALLMVVVFIFSFVFAVIDNGYSNISSFELGKETAQMMKYFLKNLGILALIVLTYRLFKENNQKNIQ